MRPGEAAQLVAQPDVAAASRVGVVTADFWQQVGLSSSRQQVPVLLQACRGGQTPSLGEMKAMEEAEVIALQEDVHCLASPVTRGCTCGEGRLTLCSRPLAVTAAPRTQRQPVPSLRPTLPPAAAAVDHLALKTSAPALLWPLWCGSVINSMNSCTASGWSTPLWQVLQPHLSTRNSP